MKISEHTSELVHVSPPGGLANASQSSALLPGGMNPIEGGSSLGQFTTILGRQKAKLLSFIAVAMIAAGILQFTLPKLYESTAIVKVDRHAAPGIVGPQASQVSSVDDMDQIITTQIELAQSDPVLRPIVKHYDLLNEEHQLRRFFFWKLSPEEVARKSAAPVELKRLKVKRPPNTYLIEISYRAYDPKLAAEVANAVAKSLADHANDTASKSSVEVNALIAQNMRDLKTKMDASERKLVQYQKELNMVDPEQRTTILTARLAQLSTEYTSAQTERIRREAMAEEVTNTPTIAATQAAEAEYQRSLLDNAVENLNQARGQFTAVRSFYAERHPEYRKSKAQLDEAQAQVDALRLTTSDKVRAQYDQALGRESRLKDLVGSTKAEANEMKSKAEQYNQLMSEAAADKKLYQDLETQTREADINDQFQNATIRVFAPGLPADEAIFPRLFINLPLAFVTSAILGILGVVLVDALDTTFSEPEEVARQLGVDVLASIPVTKSLQNAKALTGRALNAAEKSDPKAAASLDRYWESIRTLRNSIFISTFREELRTLLITSSVPAEGKSTTAAQLAVACAQVGKRVLLIDADLRRPSLHRQFGVSGLAGLSDLLAGGVGTRYDDPVVRVGNPELSLMPAGPIRPHTGDLLNIGFSDVLGRVSRDYDITIVDAPPMLGISDVQSLASMVDGVLVIAKADSTTGKELSLTLAGLLRMRANVLGVAINHVKKTSTAGYGYYYSNSTNKNTSA